MGKLKEIHQTWLELFLHNCRNSNRSEHTLKSYRSDLFKYVGWFEATYPQRELNEANTEIISRYLDYLGAQNRSEMSVPVVTTSQKTRFLPQFLKKMFRVTRDFFQNVKNDGPIATLFRTKILKVSSKRRHLSTINNFYEYLRQRNADDKKVIFKNNPVKLKIHSISVKEKDVDNTRLLTPEHWDKICDTVYKIEDRLMLHLLYFGGLRLSELTFLKLKDFNAQNKSINFIRKGGDVHRLKIYNFDYINHLLNDYLSTKKVSSDYVFTGKSGKPYATKTIYNHIMKIFLKSGLSQEELGPHSFRKACATNLYKKTKDLLLVRDYLNHSDAKVTQTYIEY